MFVVFEKVFQLTQRSWRFFRLRVLLAFPRAPTELQEAPKGFEKFVDFERTASFRESLLECDVIVYDLMSNSFEEVDYVIKTLKTSPLTS